MRKSDIVIISPSSSSSNINTVIEVLPVTYGTDKQISYAYSTKVSLITSLLNWSDQPCMLKFKDRFITVIEKLNSIIDSKVILKHKDDNNKEIIKWIESI